MVEDTLFSAYNHTHGEEKGKFLRYMIANRKTVSQQLEDRGVEASDAAQELAALAQRKESFVSAHDEASSAALQFGREQYFEPLFWEYVLQTHPASSEAATAELKRDLNATMAAVTAPTLDTDERRRAGFTALKSLIAQTDDDASDYESWGVLCTYGEGTGSFVFYTWEWSYSSCAELAGLGRSGAIEEESSGYLAGMQIGFSVGAGVAYYRELDTTYGISYRFGLGGLIETVFDIDVDTGFSYETSDQSTSIIAVYVGIDIGVEIGFSALSFTETHGYVDEKSDSWTDIPEEWDNTESCFPGDARVTLESGASKRMDALELGDVVQTVDAATGVRSFAPVYLFGHRDPSASSEMVLITTSSGEVHTLSKGHFLPVGVSWAAREMVRAADVVTNMTLFVADSSGAPSLAKVVSVDRARKTGLFNPFTRDGIIVVNGIVASEYSEWFLDGIVPARFLPAIYHAIQAPLARHIAPAFPHFMEALDGALSQGGPKFDVRGFVAQAPYIMLAEMATMARGSRSQLSR